MSSPGFRKHTPPPAPPPNLYPAVCVDVIYRGIVKRTYNNETKEGPEYRLRWMIDPAAAQQPDGKPFFVQQDYTSSLHPKANLHKHLASWFGRTELSKEQIDGFGMEGGPDKLVGLSCRLKVLVNDKGYAKIADVMPRDPNSPKLALPTDYVREQDRPGYVMPGTEPLPEIQQDQQGATGGVTEDDCPF